MVKKYLCCFICIVFSICCFSQKIKTVDGEYTYVVPENVNLDKAKYIALERLKIQLIEEEFLLVPRDERPQLAEEVIRRALSRSDTEVVLIDGINVLFAPILNLNPLELLKTISKTYPIVVGWRGHLEGDQLYLEHNNDPKHAVVTVTKPERVMVID